MKFIYIGHCAAGFVQFADPKANGKPIVMPEGEAVEVPEWLAKKLANNNHFEAVSENFDALDFATAEPNADKPPRKKPGPKPKVKADDAN